MKGRVHAAQSELANICALRVLKDKGRSRQFTLELEAFSVCFECNSFALLRVIASVE